MSSTVLYLISMLKYMMLTFPALFLGRLLLGKVNGVNWLREIMFWLFITFLVGLASQTIVPEIGFDNGFYIVDTGTGNINLIPLKGLIITYVEIFHFRYIDYFLINFVGNILIFMPIGFCLPLLWDTKAKKVILIGFLISLYIEICQLFLNRGTDVDDLILNTIGTIFGLLLYKLLNKSKRINKFFNKFKKED